MFAETKYRKSQNFFDLFVVLKKAAVLGNLRCGKVILVFGPCADVRQANGATDLGPQRAAAR